MNRLLLIVLVGISLAGCFRQTSHTIAYKSWQKPGASEDEVKRAQLECGYPNPLGSSSVPMDDNSIALSSRCMTKNGFINTDYLKYTHGKTFCEKHPEIPACHLPLDQIPDRSVAKRLNSQFCKEFPQATVCQP